MKREKISNAVVRRLPRYYRYLDNLHYDGIPRISSQMLGNLLGYTASQIRQDLSCFGEFGQQGYGYNVETLRAEIADILGINRKRKCIIVGLGNLGSALMHNFTFDKYGFTLEAAFDIRPHKAFHDMQGVALYHVDEMETQLARIQPDMAVLTTTRSVASQIANRLVASGVRGIWNYTNIELKLDRAEDVTVENVHFADSLLALGFLLAERERESQQTAEDIE